MNLFKGKKGHLLPAVIITISVVGILYFGYRAISENSKKNGENPFEYNIDKYKKSGTDLIHYSEVGQIPIGLKVVYGLSVGSDDRLYVSGDTSVLILDQDGNIQSTISTSEEVNCLAVDENQDMYFGMEDHVEIYDEKGTRKAVWESLGEYAILTSIAVSKENVFIADAGNYIVWKFDKSGNKQIRIGDKNETKDIPGFIIPSPYFDVDLDSDGFLWVVNPGRHSLENYTNQGDFRTSWGESSMEIKGFSGCCNPSHFTILEDGSFVTSEKGISRIKIYNRLGNLVSVVAGPDQFKDGTDALDLAIDSSQQIYVLDPSERSVRIFAKK